MKAILNNINWLLFGKIITMSSNMVALVFIARYLGAEQFGTLSYFLAMVSLLTPFFSLGLASIVTREIINSTSGASRPLSSAIALRALSTVFFGMIFYVLYLTFSDDTTHSKLLAVLLLCNMSLAITPLEYWFESQVKSKYVVLSRIISTILFSLLKIYFSIFTSDLEAVGLMYGLESIALYCMIYYFFRTCGGEMSFRSVDFSYGIGLVKQSAWLMLSGVAAIIYLKIDQIMLAVMVSEAEVGVYSVAVRISEVWYFLPQAVAGSFFALLIKSKAKSNSEYIENIARFSSALYVLALALSVVIFFISAPLIDFLFGEEYTKSAQILTIHIWSTVFVFVRAIFSKWLIIESLYKYSLLSQLAGALVNVVLNYLLIPLYGGVGAAWATVISCSVSAYFILFVSSKTRWYAIMLTKLYINPIKYIQR